MKGQLLFLGTGGSSGVPIIGCHCKVCSSPLSVNQRLRSSALLRVDEKQILVDAGPDFRFQALEHRIEQLDGVILTHAHFDHIGGLDDLRIFFLRQSKPLPCLLSLQTYEEIAMRYSYLFRPQLSEESIKVQFDFHLLKEDFGLYNFLGLRFICVSYFQAGVKVLGFRLGDLAYISDIREFSPRVIEELYGVDQLVVSALRKNPSYMHFNLEEAVDFSQQVGARQTWITHISHELEHISTSRELPSNVALAYDGLTIDFNIAEQDLI